MADPNNSDLQRQFDEFKDIFNQEISALEAQNANQQKEISALKEQNANQEGRLDEIEGWFNMRELVTRLDKVIVKSLIHYLGLDPNDLDFASMEPRYGINTGRQLYHYIRRDRPHLEQKLPPRMNIRTFGAIGSALRSIKIRGNGLAHNRNLDELC